MANIEIFSGPLCSYCEQAKRLLQSLDLPYTEYDISDPAHLSEYAKRLPRSKSIPQIFINGEHIGNEEDLGILAANKTLFEKLKVKN